MCKHVGALLYFIAAEVRAGRNKSCTSQQKSWNKPSNSAVKKYTAKRMAAIRIQKAKARSIMLLNSRGVKRSRSSFDPRCLADREPMKFSTKELQDLAIASNGNCCYLLHDNPWPTATTPDIMVCNNEEVIASEDIILEPISVTSLANGIKSQFPDLSLPEKYSMFLSELKLTHSQREEVARKTSGQSNNQTWTEMRRGVITASRMLAVVRKIYADGQIRNKKSADNLVSTILNYVPSFSTKATQWGILNEPVARNKYKTAAAKKHKDFRLNETGIVLSTQYPYLGASPDALVECSCCGKGIAEFKCTWSHREKTAREMAQIPSTCLQVNDKEIIQLNQKHEYFYQLVMLMAINDVHYGDFYLMTSVDSHCQRICFDEQLWKKCLPKLCSFFSQCILPELFTSRIEHEHIVQRVIRDLIDSVESHINPLSPKQDK